MSAEAAVMILAGGTGGHIFPGLAVAAELRARGVPVVWLGSSHGLENRLVPAAGIHLDTIKVSGLRGKGALALLTAPLRLLRSLWQAARILRRQRPRCVLSLGGFAAGPGGLMAWLLRRPLVVHEQNRVPGLTNRVLARFARRVLCGFPDTFAHAFDAQTVGNPVRREIEDLPAPDERFAARGDARRLLVLGGSQGARALNLALPQAITALRGEFAIEVRHQCGERHRAEPSRPTPRRASRPPSRASSRTWPRLRLGRSRGLPQRRADPGRTRGGRRRRGTRAVSACGGRSPDPQCRIPGCRRGRTPGA
jgi:UDP-N-acetylglucosamine--N-acetylmuramyl-(pentapeptide) pyrophosphoryl-undecaprenol N-acetylglucosamine transferase